MKRFLFISIVSFCISATYSQNTNPTTGPVIQEYGQVYNTNEVDLNLDKNTDYQVIFDIYTDSKSKSEINPLINTVARFINMHAREKINPDNFDIVVVLHGPATKNALSDEAHKSKFKRPNPNLKLIQILEEHRVKFYVCGQSLASQEFEKADLTPEVQMSLSALTALVHYQSEGYELINFN